MAPTGIVAARYEASEEDTCPGVAQLLGGLPMAGPHWPALLWTAPASVPREKHLFPWQFQTERIPDRAESPG